MYLLYLINRIIKYKSKITPEIIYIVWTSTNFKMIVIINPNINPNKLVMTDKNPFTVTLDLSLILLCNILIIPLYSISNKNCIEIISIIPKKLFNIPISNNDIAPIRGMINNNIDKKEKKLLIKSIIFLLYLSPIVLIGIWVNSVINDDITVKRTYFWWRNSFLFLIIILLFYHFFGQCKIQ